LKVYYRPDARRGLFIGRFQPFHKGHLMMIKLMDRSPDIDEIIIGIGSAQYDLNRRSPEAGWLHNPFTLEERQMMIRSSIEGIVKPVAILPVWDVHDYSKWFPYVKAIMPPFHVIYAGNTVVRMLASNDNIEVRGIDEEKRLMSGTKIRNLALSGGDYRQYLPEGTLKVWDSINAEYRLKELARRDGL